MVVVILLQLPLASCLDRLRTRLLPITDSRLKLLHHAFSGIRTIKAQAWEEVVRRPIEKSRNQEVQQQIRLNSLKLSSFSLLKHSSTLAVVVVLYSSHLSGIQPKSNTAFTLLAAFSFLSLYFGIYTGYAITTFAELKASFARTSALLSLPTQTSSYSQAPSQVTGHLQLSNASFSWQEAIQANQSLTQRDSSPMMKNSSSRVHPSSHTNPQVLSNLNFRIKSGQLVAVVGPVGSGKTSLLLSLLSETVILEESKMRKRENITFSYTSQDPFLMPDSIVNNITMGLKYEEVRFKEVSQQCCLLEDYAQLKNGENTQVGDRGQNLSGGQRARVSLARALYSNAEVYLLDDPLSAVDPGVLSRLMQGVVLGALARKTRILVTHQRQVLPHADKIFFLKEGKLCFFGTYEEFRSTGLDVQELLEQSREGEPEKEEDREVDIQKIIEAQEKKAEDQEIQAQAGAGIKTIFKFASLCCRCFSIPLIFILSAIPAVLQIFISEIINLWINAPHSSHDFYAQALLLITFGFLLASILRNIAITSCILRSSRSLHRAMLRSLLYTALSFFDKNPVGKLLTRFSKDIAILDTVLPVMVTYFIEAWGRVLSILILVSIINPWIVPAIVLVFALAFLIRNRLLSVQCQIMSLEMQSRAPIITHISSCLSDLPSIRASPHTAAYLIKQFQSLIDRNGAAFMTYYSLVCTLAAYLDFVTWFLISLVAFLSIVIRNDENATLLILSLQLVLDLVDTFQYGTILSSEVLSYFASVSRCFEYSSLYPEERSSPSSQELKLDQPSLQFQNVSLRYGDELGYALSEVSFKVNPGSKVGVVGRTGAGKSSLLQALFRLSPIEGTIRINGIDISKIALASLRSKVAFIPQTPFLFQGTIRKQLNPEERDICDDELWQTLRVVQLDQLVESFPEMLDTTVSSNLLSQGQKQLLCLGRALLRRNKLVVLDEATANIDLQTDRIVQEVLRTQFKECTVVTIAHRLESIISSDWVIVLDQGKLVEQGTPLSLLVEHEEDREVSRSTLFAKMMRETKQSANLLEKARAARIMKLNENLN